MSPLEEATTEDLVNELARRHVASIFAGRTNQMDDGKTSGCVQYVNGSPDACLGLIHATRVRAETMYRLEVMAEFEDDDDDEEE